MAQSHLEAGIASPFLVRLCFMLTFYLDPNPKLFVDLTPSTLPAHLLIHL